MIKVRTSIYVYMVGPESEVGGPLAAATLDVTEAVAMDPPPTSVAVPPPTIEPDC